MKIEETGKIFIAHHKENDESQLLIDHLLGVSELAKTFSKKIGIQYAGELIGLLHDFGKYSMEFQNYIKSAVGLINQDEDDYVDASGLKGKIDHSTAGAQFIWQELSNREGLEEKLAQIMALCIASHHSGLIDCLSPSGEDNFIRRMQKIQEKTHIEEAYAVADKSLLEKAHDLLSNPTLINELKLLMQRIAEKNSSHAAPLHLQFGLAVRFLFSALIDADRIDTADFEHKGVKAYRPKSEYIPWKELIVRLEQHLTSMPIRNSIDNLRRDISQHCLNAASWDKGIYTLTVPTGGGKTLASLRFALHHVKKRQLDRIIYVIPFTSIIDQNAQVVRDILETEDLVSHKGKIVLEHHASVTPEQQTWREKILCENWDAPIVYTTMVQFLESLFGAGTRGARRMHQLANTVLIFDEIQTLPVKCVHLFNNAINFLVEQCNSTVVLCTATQPLLNTVSVQRGAIRLSEKHEIMPDKQKLFDDLKRVDVYDQRRPGGWTYSDIVALAIRERERAGSCLLIVNTKDAAKKIYEVCKLSIARAELFHLSTDMCPAHRKDNLEKIRQRLDENLPIICVSTQLIEAGVDVDFNVVIRSLAGLDSIAQAAGRCNRNGRHEKGVVHIVNSSEENLGRLEDILIGQQKSQRILDDYREKPELYCNSLVSPQAMSDYYKYYFYERQDEMAYCLNSETIGHDDTLLNMLADNQIATKDFHRSSGSPPNRLLNQSFMAAAKAFKAIDAPTQGIIVPYGKEGKNLISDLYAAYDIELEIGLLKRAQQFTVNVFPQTIEKLTQAGALQKVKEDTRILTVDHRYYSSEFGLSSEPLLLMESLYVDTPSKQH